jgi:hypothetical protein
VLPLGPEDQLEALRHLASDGDDEVREAAAQTLRSYDAPKLRPIVEDPTAAPGTLAFLASWKWLPRDIYQPLIFHERIPADALAHIAATTELSDVIELVSLRQQSLIQSPKIIDAILANPRRTPEAERRAREVREEFFEKDYGAGVIAGEQRARGETDTDEAQSAGAQTAEPEALPADTTFVDDLAQFIEADLVATGNELYEQYIEEMGIDEAALPVDQPMPGFDLAKYFSEDEEFVDEEARAEIEERISVLARIVTMTVKQRIQFALKGTREVRMILIRDASRPVCSAVLRNPRLTDNEVEMVAGLRSVHEEVLRIIGTNRAWTRSYAIIHNLVRNPKTPVAISLTFLNRIQTRDLRLLASNKGIPEVVRTSASRMYIKRQHG